MSASPTDRPIADPFPPLDAAGYRRLTRMFTALILLLALGIASLLWLRPTIQTAIVLCLAFMLGLSFGGGLFLLRLGLMGREGRLLPGIATLVVALLAIGVLFGISPAAGRRDALMVFATATMTLLGLILSGFIDHWTNQVIRLQSSSRTFHTGLETERMVRRRSRLIQATGERQIQIQTLIEAEPEIKRLEQSLPQLEKELAELRQRHRTVRQTNAGLEAQIAHLQTDLTKLETSIRLHERKITDLRQILAHRQSLIDQQTAELIDLEKQRQTLSNDPAFVPGFDAPN